MMLDCARNADEMNDQPNARQQPLVGFTLDKVNSAHDLAKRAQANLNEIIWHRLEKEEIYRLIAMINSDLSGVICELNDAKLAGK